jgi:hypothetical protein
MRKDFCIGMLLLTFVLAGHTYDLFGQMAFSSVGPLSLHNRQAEVKPGGMVTNVVRVINQTGQTGEFGLMITQPAGWQVVGSRERSFTMRAADTLFFPVRIIALSQIQRAEPQVVSVALTQFRNVIASENWVVRPILRSEWSATITQKQIVLHKSEDTVSVSLNVINTGDLPEIFSMDLVVGNGINLINHIGDIVLDRESRFRLDPLADTNIRFVMKMVDLRDALSQSKMDPSVQSLRLRIQLISEPQAGMAPKSWSANVDIKKLDQQWVENPSSYIALPLTVQFNAYNILDENAYGDLSLYGFHLINPETSLSYYFQSNFISNYLNPYAFLGQYVQISLNSKYFGVQLGNVSQTNEGANLSGEGVKVYGKYNQHVVSATVAQNPGIFQQAFNIRGLAADYNYSSRTISGGAFIHFKENNTQRTEDNVVGGRINYRFAGTQSVRAAIALSKQTHNWNPDSAFALVALGYNVGYAGSIRTVGYSLFYANYAPTHVVRRGTESFNARVSWRLSTKHNIFGAFSQIDTDPQYYFRGVIRPANLTRFRQIYRMGYQYVGSLSDIAFQPQHHRFDDPFIKHAFSGVELDYRVKEFHNLRFYSSAMAGYTHLPDFETDPFFTARIRTSIRYHQYALNVRYYYGPYYANELLRFAETRQNSSRVGAGVDFDQPFLNGLFNLRFSSLYNYTTTNNQHSMSIRPEIFYHPQMGLRFGLYGRFFALSSELEERMAIPDIDLEGSVYSSSRYEFGFSIRKDLNVPVSGRRFYDLTVVVYSDISGTGTRQSSDPGLRDMWVRLQAIDAAAGDGMAIAQGAVFETLTNRDGKAYFVNIPPGSYLATIVPVAQAGSRYEARTYEIMVSDDRTVYLSIDRGARVSGSIILDRDQYTRAEYFPVGSIRITATDQEGQKFSTLTSETGQYSLYLPKGKYNISLNESIFSDKFDLQQNNVPVEILFEQEIVTVNFIAKERARQIRIQQPNNGRQDD